MARLGTLLLCAALAGACSPDGGGGRRRRHLQLGRRREQDRHALVAVSRGVLGEAALLLRRERAAAGDPRRTIVADSERRGGGDVRVALRVLFRARQRVAHRLVEVGPAGVGGGVATADREQDGETEEELHELHGLSLRRASAVLPRRETHPRSHVRPVRSVRRAWSSGHAPTRFLVGRVSGRPSIGSAPARGPMDSRFRSASRTASASPRTTPLHFQRSGRLRAEPRNARRT